LEVAVERTSAAAAAVSERRVRPDVSLVGLLSIRLGRLDHRVRWLSGALLASKVAGPAASISWAVGGGAMLLLHSYPNPFTNAIAFSPTDAMPLTRRVKMMMLAESAISATTVLLVAARAVNILR
jgi:hypothetical protein